MSDYRMLLGQIDVTKIDKTALFKGKKGTYLDVVLRVKDDDDQYGNNGFIAQGLSKERREAGDKGVILGNVKWTGDQPPQQAYNPKDSDDKLPF